jgi:hypothetical protein
MAPCDGVTPCDSESWKFFDWPPREWFLSGFLVTRCHTVTRTNGTKQSTTNCDPYDRPRSFEAATNTVICQARSRELGIRAKWASPMRAKATLSEPRN